MRARDYLVDGPGHAHNAIPRLRGVGAQRSKCRHCDSPAGAGASTKAVAPNRGHERSDLGVRAVLEATTRFQSEVKIHTAGRITSTGEPLCFVYTEPSESWRLWYGVAETSHGHRPSSAPLTGFGRDQELDGLARATEERSCDPRCSVRGCRNPRCEPGRRFP